MRDNWEHTQEGEGRRGGEVGVGGGRALEVGVWGVGGGGVIVKRPGEVK